MLIFLAQVVIGDRCWLAVCLSLLVDITYVKLVQKVGGALPAEGTRIERAIETEVAQGVREIRAQFEAAEATVAQLRSEAERQMSLRPPYGRAVVVEVVEGARARVESSLY